jgi:glycosyltransferase involved in cell wall biosynthesis
VTAVDVQQAGEAAIGLSVIVPCLDAAGTIEPQLEALAQQRWSEPWELLVVDNGSTDETLETVERYRGRIANLRVVDASDKQSQPYAMNRGVEAARGESVAFCDADDVVAPGWVAAIGEAVRRDAFVASRLELDTLNEPWVLASRGRQQDEGLQQGRYPPFLPHASSTGMAVQRAVHERVGGFDDSTNYLFDTDFCYAVQLSGTPLRFAPDAVVHYRYRATIGGIYRQARNYARSDARLQAKYGPPAKLPPWRWAVTYWRTIARSLPRATSRAGRARLAWLLGWQIGRLRGSLQHRVLAA